MSPRFIPSWPDRAAQFSPFAALTGYEMVIHEAGRMTDQQIELDEDARNMLDEKLKTILKQTGNRQEAKITFFQPDAKKEGGIYVTATGLVKEIDTYHRAVVMMEGKRIPLEHIVEVETNPSF